MSWRNAAPADAAPTSRALNLTLERAEIFEVCARRDMAISAIETLLSGGTRVVLQSADDAAQLRRTWKAKLIPGPVRRAAWAAHRGNDL